jgi:peptide/nickel transport system substrate-binding protein
MAEYQAAEDVVQKYDYDPELARQLLAEAGYPDGFTVDLTWTNQARFFEPMQIVQAQLKEIGIEINLNVVEHSTYREAIDEIGQVMAMISISRDTPDAVAKEWFLSTSIPPYGSTAKYNYAHYGEAIPGVDDLVYAAISATDPKEAIELYVAIQKQVMEDLPIIPLFQGWSEPFAMASYVDLGYEWHAPDRRYPVFTELTRILNH